MLDIFFTKWPPTAILDDRKSLTVAFFAILDQYTTFNFFEIIFDCFSHHFDTQLFVFKFFLQNGRRRPAAILDDRKYLLIAFIAISHQYTIFLRILGICFTKRPPAAILDDRKSRLIAFIAILDQYATINFF